MIAIKRQVVNTSNVSSCISTLLESLNAKSTKPFVLVLLFKLAKPLQFTKQLPLDRNRYNSGFDDLYDIVICIVLFIDLILELHTLQGVKKAKKQLREVFPVFHYLVKIAIVIC